MKAIAKQLSTYGNLGLVQIQVEPETSFLFKPGALEMNTGGLIISESTGVGVVGKLMAENNTSQYLLLTDADVLVGAKQNRILNKSMLLSPKSKTIIDVSCVERLRWQYSNKNFSSPNTVADPDLRKNKVESIVCFMKGPKVGKDETQSKVWSHINEKIREKEFASLTENYEALNTFRMNKDGHRFPDIASEKGCNGLAVIIDGKVNCIDLFGTEEIYKHYFPKLRDSAFRMANNVEKIKSLDVHEAYYKVLDTLDTYETAERTPEKDYTGAGSFNMVDSKELVGFDLNFEGQMIHNVLFSK